MPESAAELHNLSPVLQAYGLSDVSLSRPESANMAQVYVVEDSYILRGRGGSAVVRNRFDYERRVLERVRGLLPLEIPRLLPTAAGEDYCLHGGILWTLHRRLEGEVLGHWYELQHSPPERHVAVMKLLRTIHDSARGNAGEDLFRPALLLELFEPYRNALPGMLPPELHERIALAASRFEEFCSSQSAARAVFLHGDYHHGNILADATGRPTGLIDFDWCHFGHPVDDLGFTLLMLLRLPRNPHPDIDALFFRMLLNAYGAHFSAEERTALKDSIVLYGALDFVLFLDPAHPRHEFWSKCHGDYYCMLCGRLDELL